MLKFIDFERPKQFLEIIDFERMLDVTAQTKLNLKVCRYFLIGKYGSERSFDKNRTEKGRYL